MKPLSWVAFYPWGTVTAAESEWGVLPDGIVEVVLIFPPDRHGEKVREFCGGSDWYGFDSDGEFHHGRTHDVKGQWIECDLPPSVPVENRKRGLWIDDEVFAAVQAQVTEV